MYFMLYYPFYYFTLHIY